MNRYVYVSNNPVNLYDPSGNEGAWGYGAVLAAVQGAVRGGAIGAIGGFAASGIYVFMARLGVCGGDVSQEWFLDNTNAAKFIAISTIVGGATGAAFGAGAGAAAYYAELLVANGTLAAADLAIITNQLKSFYLALTGAAVGAGFRSGGICAGAAALAGSAAGYAAGGGFGNPFGSGSGGETSTSTALALSGCNYCSRWRSWFILADVRTASVFSKQSIAPKWPT